MGIISVPTGNRNNNVNRANHASATSTHRGNKKTLQPLHMYWHFWLYTNASRQFWGCACAVSRDRYVKGGVKSTLLLPLSRKRYNIT